MRERESTGPGPLLLVVAGTVVLCLGLTGCVGKQPKQTQFMKKVGGVQMSAEELRLHMREVADNYIGKIEDAANRIMEQTDDPSVRRRALTWKARAIPASQQAIFQRDPLVALIDTWAFTLQMLEFFESGEGRDAFGELQSIALDACRWLDRAAERLARDVARDPADVPGVRESLGQYAREYPIESWSFNRESVPSHMDAFQRAKSAGGLAAAGSLATDMSDVSARVGLLAMLMPRQVMWETELLAESYVTHDEVDRALADLTDIPDSVDELRLFAEDSVARVLQEKEALLGEVQQGQSALGQAFETTLAFITLERQAVIAELKAERALVLEALSAERAIVVEALQVERAAVMEEMGALSDGTVETLGTRLEDVIDHFFLRLVQLLVPLLVVVALGAWLLVRALRPKAA